MENNINIEETIKYLNLGKFKREQNNETLFKEISDIISSLNFKYIPSIGDSREYKGHRDIAIINEKTKVVIKINNLKDVGYIKLCEIEGSKIFIPTLMSSIKIEYTKNNLLSVLYKEMSK